MLKDNAMDQLNFSLRNRHLRVRWTEPPIWKSRQLPPTSVVPLSLRSNAVEVEAAEMVSHSGRDLEEVGRSEEHRNSRTPPTGDDVRHH